MEFERDPTIIRYKKMTENELNKRFKVVLQDTRESDEANAVCLLTYPSLARIDAHY